MYISILGDSISTLLNNSIPKEGVYYNNTNYNLYKLKDIKDTWWGIYLDYFKYDLCVNNSYLGSKVKGGYYPCGFNRAKELNKDNIYPDLIIVFLGTNDFYFNTKLDDFYNNYLALIDELKSIYKNSKIALMTIPLSVINHKYLTKLNEYNEIIRSLSIIKEVILYDIAKILPLIDSKDEIHPGLLGHKQIASALIKIVDGSFKDEDSLL